MNIDEAVAAVRAGQLTKTQAVMAVSPDQVEARLHAGLAGRDTGAVVGTGMGASPGAAVGRVYFDVDSCLDAADRGEPVIFCAEETTPADEIAMRVADGIVTVRGGSSSHAAVVARGWGIPAICGVNGLTVNPDEMTIGDVVIAEGATVSIDGATGEMFLGDLGLGGGGPSEGLDVLLGWADEIRGTKVGIRANSDSGADAALARELGAEGVGLCRTEHMFLGDRLGLVQNVILADDEADALTALTELGAMQQTDFVALLQAMDGLPVTVRLLDPPLHEFLPDPVTVAVAEAKGELDDQARALATAAHRWAESNPMLGTRGVRLAIIRDGLYHMQVRALLAAVKQCRADGGTPIVSIMIPLVSEVRELATVRSWIDQELAAAGFGPADGDHDILVGTMIETPRAALTAAAIAEQADFFSFGTNDLTQLTWGYSRDDVEARVLTAYLDQGLLDANPFERLDRVGVGTLIDDAIASARRVRPGLEVGVCGEHGGDPESIEFLVGAGVDYVSCSPYRVPVARLALAQTVAAAG